MEYECKKIKFDIRDSHFNLCLVIYCPTTTNLEAAWLSIQSPGFTADGLGSNPNLDYSIDLSLVIPEPNSPRFVNSFDKIQKMDYESNESARDEDSMD